MRQAMKPPSRSATALGLSMPPALFWQQEEDEDGDGGRATGGQESRGAGEPESRRMGEVPSMASPRPSASFMAMHMS